MEKPQQQLIIPDVNLYEMLGRAQAQIAALINEVQRLMAENETLKAESKSKLKAV